MTAGAYSVREDAAALEGSMVHLTFFLDGRKICANDLGLPLEHLAGIDRLERIMLLAVRSHVRRRLRDMSCEEHRQAPRVIATGSCPERLTFIIQGCCQRLVAEGTAALDDGDRVRPLSVVR
jgi:hypothetical protein